jgi:hypothetical protein
MAAFVEALASGSVGSGELSFHTALDSHLMAFAAEESRLSGARVDFPEWAAAHAAESRPDERGPQEPWT